MDYKKLKDAADALERAARAVWRGQQYPHSYSVPCCHHIIAARAEIDCARALVDEAEAS